MKIISVDAVRNLIHRHGFSLVMKDLIEVLRRDFSRWDQFTKMPRPAMHVPGGVLELMPVCDNELYYSFKYVNCHPKNPERGKQTVVATGQLSRIDTGYPVMFSEMTLLTALRTAATTALLTDLMARSNARTVALIGTGAQSEFQIHALMLVRDITEVRYFDIDPAAMDKFEKNMSNVKLKLTRCTSAEQALQGADIVTVCTACKEHVDVIMNDWVVSGMHINALGGDTIGKTELEKKILPRCKTVVEYFDQSFIEGEIQRFSEEEARTLVHAEIHELVNGQKKGRESEDEITLYDSVGIGLEDYSVLRLVYELSEKYGIGEEIGMVPEMKDPKDVWGLL